MSGPPVGSKHHQDRKKWVGGGAGLGRSKGEQTGRLTIALGILEGGVQLPLCDWLTDVRKKESLS